MHNLPILVAVKPSTNLTSALVRLKSGKWSFQHNIHDSEVVLDIDGNEHSLTDSIQSTGHFVRARFKRAGTEKHITILASSVGR